MRCSNWIILNLMSLYQNGTQITTASSKHSICVITSFTWVAHTFWAEIRLHHICAKQRTTIQIMKNTWTMAFFLSWPTIWTIHLHLDWIKHNFRTFQNANANFEQNNGTKFTVTLNYPQPSDEFMQKIEVQIFGLATIRRCSSHNKH